MIMTRSGINYDNESQKASKKTKRLPTAFMHNDSAKMCSENDNWRRPTWKKLKATSTIQTDWLQSGFNKMQTRRRKQQHRSVSTIITNRVQSTSEKNKNLSYWPLSGREYRYLSANRFPVPYWMLRIRIWSDLDFLALSGSIIFTDSSKDSSILIKLLVILYVRYILTCSSFISCKNTFQ